MPSESVKGRSDFARALEFHQASSFGYFEQAIPAPAVNHPGSADPVPASLEKVSFLRGFLARCSSRVFGGNILKKQVLDAILWAGYGRINSYPEWERRTVPSAGGIYPLRLCLFIQKVEGMARGFYSHENGYNLLPIKLSLDVSEMFLTSHIHYETASVIIFLMGDLERMGGKYGERGYRYLLIEAGHCAQNICLTSAALAIPHITVGGFDDTVVNDLLAQSDQEVCLYSVILGAPSE